MIQNPLEKFHERDKNSQRINPVLIGVVGVIAGAASVTTLALSDKDIRKKVGKRATEMRVTLQEWSSAKLQEYTKEPIYTVIEETEEPMQLEETIKN